MSVHTLVTIKIGNVYHICLFDIRLQQAAA